jgi:hypothetical protein
MKLMPLDDSRWATYNGGLENGNPPIPPEIELSYAMAMRRQVGPQGRFECEFAQQGFV